MKKIFNRYYKVLFTFCAAIVFSLISSLNVYAKEPELRYFMQGDAAAPSKTPYGNNLKASHYVLSGDARIYYEVYEEKKAKENATVFVFHGGGVGSPFEMGELIDSLRKNHQVVAVSSRGHGHSEIGHSAMTFEQKANDMMTVIKAVTDKKAILVGFSDGAYTAYKVATMYPEAVEKIVIIGAGTLKKGFFSSDAKVSDLEAVDKAYIDQLRKIMPEPERYQEFCSNYMLFWSNMEVGQELFSKIQCPALLIAGDQDDHAPVETMVEAYRMISGSQLCIVPKAGHSAFLNNFDVVWAAVSAFLEENK
ncbi:MAG: alpha/beta hydrolase [Treponema sp.]|nr:alpha/beta hydrolase [Treponema sp.]